MALRLPIPTRSVRRPSRARSVVTIGISAFVLVVLPFEANLVGNAKLTEVAALLVFSALAGYLLALLTVRRRR